MYDYFFTIVLLLVLAELLGAQLVEAPLVEVFFFFSESLGSGASPAQILSVAIADTQSEKSNEASRQIFQDLSLLTILGDGSVVI